MANKDKPKLMLKLTPCRVRRLHAIARFISSAANHKKPGWSLPDAKMRALVAIYHQADSFITPENLSDRIDEAFVPLLAEKRTRIRIDDLKALLNEQRDAPKMSQWDHGSMEFNASPQLETNWSSFRTGRERKVIEALYGVDTLNPNLPMPGLETLQEEHEKQKATGFRQYEEEELEEDEEIMGRRK